MNAPASPRVPSRREAIYRLSVATGLAGVDVARALDGVYIGLDARGRVERAAATMGMMLPSDPSPPPRRRSAPEAEAPRPPRATDAAPRVPPLPGRGGRGRGSDARRREALSRRHELNTNRDAAPPRGPQEAA